MCIGNKLKVARTYLGMTQTEMGEAVGKTKNGWQTYERGSSVPGGKVFEELAKLGFNAGWFFSDDVPMLSKDIKSPPAAASSPVENNTTIDHMPSDSMGLGESVELLAKIYNSGNTVLIRAIAANLSAFSEAIDNKALAQKAIDMMDEMNKRMLALETDLTTIKEENKALKKRLPGDDQMQSTG